MLRHKIINDNIIVLWMYITYPETVVLNIYTETGTIITLCFIPTAAVIPVTITIRTIRVYRTGKVWHVYITWIVKYISNRKQKPFYGNKIWVFFFYSKLYCCIVHVLLRWNNNITIPDSTWEIRVTKLKRTTSREHIIYCES